MLIYESTTRGKIAKSTAFMMNGDNHVNNDDGDRWPKDVGILAMEIYFPSQFVDQAELETFDGSSAGKYTKGLGQTQMGFCSDREDVASLCLTVVDKLMAKYGVSYEDIGRLEVGTETLIDKSKSVKSVLMQLFADSGNTDVEGVDSTNACYGGTAALFNSIAWIESSAWDGHRYALAVCADIAVYASGPARPTGGAGAVAMLVGPGASLVLERGLRASHVAHEYDFYKPVLSSEYPTVDGPLSIRCYLSALDKCYARYKAKAKARGQGSTKLASFDAVLFHSPFCKLVQKSLARLALNDFVEAPDGFPESIRAEFGSVRLEDTYFDKAVERAFMDHSLATFQAKTKPSLLVATSVGNMYTPSLYGGLVSFVASTEDPDDLVGRRVALFSYGSGLASSFFSLRVVKAANGGLGKMHAQLLEAVSRLRDRRKVGPDEFARTMRLREETHHLAPYSPVGHVADLFPGTWYLDHVDDKHRRKYLKHCEAKANGNCK